MSEPLAFSDTQIAGLVIRVEEGWAYHSDLGLYIAPADCEAGLSVAEARRIFDTIDALRERLAAAEQVVVAARADVRTTRLAEALRVYDALAPTEKQDG